MLFLYVRPKTQQISTWLVWLNAWKRLKAEQNWSHLTALLCLRFAECRLTFGAQLEFMASAWRLCRVIVLLLLQKRMKGSANCWTSPLFRGLFLLSADGSDWRCQRAAQTRSCQRAGVEVRVQMPSGWNRGFTRKVRCDVWDIRWKQRRLGLLVGYVNVEWCWIF